MGEVQKFVDVGLFSRRVVGMGALVLAMMAGLVVTVLPAQAQSTGAAGTADGTEYVCPEGSTAASGSGAELVCVIETTVSANPLTAPVYSCPTGSVAVNGTSGSQLLCERIETLTVVETVAPVEETSFACPVEATPVGSGATLTCAVSSEVAVDAVVTPVLACPANSEEIVVDGAELCAIRGTAREVAPATCDTGLPNLITVEGELVCAVLAPFACPDLGTHVWTLETNADGSTICRFEPQYIAPTGAVDFSCRDLAEAGGQGETLRCLQPEQVPAQITAFCPSGSVASEVDRMQCVLTESRGVDVIETTGVSCNADELLVQYFDSSYCERVVETDVAPNAVRSFECPDEYAVLPWDGVCVIQEEVPDEPYITYTRVCANGERDPQNFFSDLCVLKTLGDPVDAVVPSGLGCPTGFGELPDDPALCGELEIAAMGKTQTVDCPAGAIPTNGLASFGLLCAFEEPVPSETGTVIECPAGLELDDADPTLCVGLGGAVAPVLLTEQVCPAGTVENTSVESLSCEQLAPVLVPADVETVFGCPDGAEEFQFETSIYCSVTTEIVELRPASPSTTYACPAGAAPSGSGPRTVCTRADGTVVASVSTTSYICSTSAIPIGTGAGTQCEITYRSSTSTEPIELGEQFVCATGTLIDAQCEIMVPSGIFVAPVAITTSQCPAGSIPLESAPVVCAATLTAPGVSVEAIVCPAGALPVDPAAATLSCVQLVPVAAVDIITWGCNSDAVQFGDGQLGTCVTVLTDGAIVPAVPITTPLCPEGSVQIASSTQECREEFISYFQPEIVPTERCTFESTRNSVRYDTCFRLDTVEEIPATPTTAYECPFSADTGPGSGADLTCTEIEIERRTANITRVASCPANAVGRQNGTALICELPAGTTIPQGARLRLIHGIPGVDVDVSIDGAMAIPNFAFGQNAELGSLAGQTIQNLSVTAAGTDALVLDAGDLSLPTEGDYTYMVHLDEAGVPVLTAFRNDIFPIQAGDARLTFRHAAAIGPLDYRLNGTPVIQGLTNASEASADLATEDLSVELFLNGTDTSVVGPEDLVMTEGRSQVVYVVGSDDGSAALLRDWHEVNVFACATGTTLIEGTNQCATGTFVETSAFRVPACPAGATLNRFESGCIQLLPEGEAELVEPSCVAGFRTDAGDACVVDAADPICPAGWELPTATVASCYRNVPADTYVNKVEESHSECPEGATERNAGTAEVRCYEVVTDLVDSIATVSLVCPADSVATGAGEDLRCERDVVNSSTVTVNAVINVDYRCASGDVELSRSGSRPSCGRTVETTVAPDAVVVAQTLTASAGTNDAAGLALEDPYVCGGGFFGTVGGGTPPYTLTYEVTSATANFNLGSFSVSGPDYTTPAGFIDYNVVPDGDYSVSIFIADSAGQTLSKPDLFTASIAEMCEVATPTPVPATATATPATATPLPTATATAVPATATATAVPATATPLPQPTAAVLAATVKVVTVTPVPVTTTQPALALTGSSAGSTALWAIAMAAVGVGIVGVSRRKRVTPLD